MAKKKRKPSKYNKHIAREMKAGKTMSQAAASWNKKKSPSTKRKTTSKKKTTRSRKKSTTRRRSRPRGQKTLFPVLSRVLFKGGPVRIRVGRFLGR